MSDFHDPKPVEKCKCGADCDWCVAANSGRKAFPNARVPPKHDAATEHECSACFMKRPDLITTQCKPRIR